jgi:hypothetical protein
MKRKYGILGILVLLSLAIASSAGATQYLLSDLIGLGSTGIRIDDKMFYNFTYSGTAVGTIAIPDYGITVTTLDTPFNPGLQFSAGWGAGPGQIQDSLIQFDVRVLQGGHAIKDIYLDFNGAADAAGFATVSENVTQGLVTLAAPYVFTFNTAQGNNSRFVDGAVFSPTLGPIHIAKDIQVNGDGVGLATISLVTNRFSEVPLPPSMLLLGSGLLGFVGIARRKLGI